MWKESYRIGVASIDEQHIQLFKLVDVLLWAIKNGSDNDMLWDTIEFLKKYVVFHFDEEEAYQRAIHYSGLEEHRKHHQNFTATVLGYEKQLIETNCDIRVLKDLAGTLTAWLIYHVAGEDQKIVTKNTLSSPPKYASCIDSFCFHALDVLQKITGVVLDNVTINKQDAPICSAPDEDVFVEIGLVEGILGTAVFGFSQKFAFDLMYSMTAAMPEQADELVHSVLAEVSSIISGNTVTAFFGEKTRCSITPPTVFTTPYVPDPGLEFATLIMPIGALSIAVKLD